MFGSVAILTIAVTILLSGAMIATVLRGTYVPILFARTNAAVIVWYKVVAKQFPLQRPCSFALCYFPRSRPPQRERAEFLFRYSDPSCDTHYRKYSNVQGRSMGISNKHLRRFLILAGGIAAGLILAFSLYLQSKSKDSLLAIVTLLPFLLATLTGIGKNTTV